MESFVIVSRGPDRCAIRQAVDALPWAQHLRDHLRLGIGVMGSGMALKARGNREKGKEN
jgi:hypothetical protein